MISLTLSDEFFIHNSGLTIKKWLVNRPMTWSQVFSDPLKSDSVSVRQISQNYSSLHQVALLILD